MDYIYPTECPVCKDDLSESGALEIYVSIGGFEQDLGPSEVDPDTGELADIDGMVAAGKHSRTMCNGCGEMLYTKEEIEWGLAD